MSKQPTLYLMMGLPGAGKTTVAKLICQLTGAEHVSSDETRRELFPVSAFTQEEHDRLYAALDEQVTNLLRTGRSVVYDANLNRYMHREEKRLLAKQLGVNTVLVWVKTPDQLARMRRVNIEPQHDLIPESETPGQMFERIASVIEEPRASESPIIINGTAVSLEDIRLALGI